MSALRKYLKAVALNELAIPSNIRYGTAIKKRDGVAIISEKDDAVEAWAGGLTGTVTEGGGSRRRVQLWIDGEQLKWHCAGNPKDHDVFCKHCVAVTLYFMAIL